MKISYPFLFIFIMLLAACQNNALNQQEPTTATPMPTHTPQPTATPAFDAAKFGTAEHDVTYCELEEGLPQKLDVYYPESGGPWPVIMYVHGGSWREGDKAEAEGLRGWNDRGYFIASVNYRMAQEGKFPVMIEDVQCAVRYLRAHSDEYNLDPSRFGVIGASAGGHLVGLLGTADETAVWDQQSLYPDQSSRVQAVVAMAGIFDFSEKLPKGLNSSVHYAFGKLAGQESPELIAASPVTYISEDDPPFLILHGDRDGVVPVAQSELFHEQLTTAGVPATLIVVQGGDHGLQGPEATPTQEEIWQTIADFLEEHLQ